MAWIETTKNGLRLYDRYKGYDGKIHKVSVPLARDTAQARKTAQEELQKKILSNNTLTTEMRLSELVEAYIDQKDIKPSSLVNYESSFKQILDALGDVLIASLTAPFCLRRLSETHKAQSTLNRYIMLLNGLFEWSYQYGYMLERIHITPIREKTKKKDADQEYLEASELKEVVDLLDGTMAGYVCKFLALTGCRVGEASALTWNDIDERYIHITKAYHKDNGITAPKTLSSRRDIFIQPELRELLKEYKEWRMLHMMAHKIRSEYLFFNNYGNIYTEQNLIGTLARISSPKHLHPHIFRHTHTALLAEQGVSLESIARRLGHTSSDITKQIYFHVTLKLKQRDEEVLSRVSIF
jgi:integrase